MHLQAIQIIQNRCVSLHSQVDKCVETDDTYVICMVIHFQPNLL